MIKATDRKLVVGLEIGTAKVAALVGEVLPDGMVNIIGVGSCPSRGMDKGGVNDLESVVKCVQRAIDQAELMADCQISSVYLALSGKHISCQNEIGMVPISEEEVTQEDVENVVHTAKSVRVRDEHRVLHVIPQEYAIDYQEGIKNPVGLSGVRMQAKVHLITCHNDMAKNIVKAVERCGLKVDQLIFAGLAASYSVLTEDERELGVCVVDIGGGTMDIAVYTGGALRHTKVIPYAGNVVTSDIAYAFGTPPSDAEAIKCATAVRWDLSLAKMRALKCRASVVVHRVACSARRWQRSLSRAIPSCSTWSTKRFYSYRNSFVSRALNIILRRGLY
ncbi:Cell division protein FtsA [Enterobacter asburiae]|nr:Cell division protein FtsA [Enterobacter asburiae]